MDAKQFLAEFGHIASAPNGIEQLRQMIYNLAIAGRLVQQKPEDGDARILLEQTEQTRQCLIQAKAYKRLPKLESKPIDEPENMVLPPSWYWTRLLDVGAISPRNEASDDELAAFIPMSGMSQLHRGSLISETREWGEIKNGFTHFANGDVVLAKITPCFENGKAAASRIRKASARVRQSFMFFEPFIRMSCRSMFICSCVHPIFVLKVNKT